MAISTGGTFSGTGVSEGGTPTSGIGSGGILSGVATGAVSTSIAPSIAASSVTNNKSLPFGLTNGWFVFFGVMGGVFLSNTKAAPVVLGVLSLGLLYQLGQLVEGK